MPDKSEPPPHYHGHRDRLRDKHRTRGAGALEDYELLELFLFRSIPRRDVKPVAKDLIARFGSISEVLGAAHSDLVQVKGISEKVADDLKLARDLGLRASQSQLRKAPLLSSWSSLLAYLNTAMAHEAREQFRVLFLDKKNRLIADEVLNTGTVDHAPVYPREILRRALELSSSALILVHNHPSGDATPSRADIDVTKDVIDACKAVNIVVHDHLIVARDHTASFKSLGLI